jgi:hypothetical protein
MKQRHPTKRKKGPETTRSIDTRLKEMTHKRRPRIRSKVARMQFRKAECKSVANGRDLLARLLECQAGQLIGLSMLVDSLGVTVVALHPAIHALLVLGAFRLLK